MRSPWLAAILASAPGAVTSQVPTVTIARAPAGTHYVEPHLAVNQRAPHEMVVAAMKVAGPSPDTWELRAFWSADSGRTWRHSTLPARGSAHCAGDPWLAWGSGRSVYLTCLAYVPRGNGRDFDYEVFLHRSRDAGRTWAAPLQVPVAAPGSWDHPLVVLAPDTPPGDDVVFIVGVRPLRGASNVFVVVPFRERNQAFDSIRTYAPPERANHIDGGAVALGSGHLLFTYFTMHAEPPRPMYAVRMGAAGFERARISESVTPWGFPMLTGGATPGAAVHAVWLTGTLEDGLNVQVSTSTDGGAHWPQTIAVTSAQPAAHRGRPNIAVDPEGRIAVTWFESTDRGLCGDVVFRTSSTSGLTFGRVMRISRGPTPCPDSGAVRRILERWRGGGDYSGIQAVGSGVFAVVWADVREDGHQIRFARVRAQE